ncbi:MAG: S1/P1 nuclease [Terriglobales bacterium]
MRRSFAAALLFLVLLLPGSAPAWAWGCAGHEVIALIAAAHLHPVVLARVRALLALRVGPADLRPCPDAAVLPPMARSAGWADAVRTPATAPFHFVDLPLTARRGKVDYTTLCPSQCLSTALDQFMAQLRDPATPARQRAVALRYVIHLTGDAFQPLHVSDNADQGGNCVRTRLPGHRRTTSLHADWDSGLLAAMIPGADPVAYAHRLDRQFGRRYAQGSLHPLDWIWASHALAVSRAFGPLHLAPGCHRQTLRLSSTYVRQARQTIARQLDRAGWRLAGVLNQLLSS